MDTTIIQFTPAIAVLVPIVIGLVQVVKNFIDSKYAMLASLVLGVAVSFLAPGISVSATILSGIVIGLTASGVYSGVKSIAS